MPVARKVDLLPQEEREWLNAELERRAFSGYEELSDALEARGYAIGKSALGKYGKEMKERFDGLMEKVRVSTEMARTMAESAGDDEGMLSDALVRMAQQKIFEILLIEDNPKRAPALAKAIADLVKASMVQKKHAIALRRQLDEKFSALEREAEGPAATLDGSTLRRIREEIYGVV